MYIAGVFIALSIPLFYPNKYIILIDILSIWSFFVYCHYHGIPIQERYLQKKFGKQYIEYESDVPRWIPKISKLLASK